MVACHFKNCQRFTGSAFLTVFAFPKDMITLTGDPRVYTQLGGTTGMPLHRVFCPDCGSSTMMYRDDTGRINIAAGTLDDASFQTDREYLLRRKASLGPAGPGDAGLCCPG
jgi:hypothetical protein